MKLKAVVDTLDGLDEAVKGLYVPFQDGDTERFRLDIDGLPNHPDALALKNALDRQKTRVGELSREKAALQTQIDEIPEDFDRDLYDRAVAEGVGGGGKLPNEDEIRQAAAAAAKKSAETEFDKERKKLVAERDRLMLRVERDVRIGALNEALDSAGVTDPVYRKAARSMLGENVQVKFDDDSQDYVAVAHDADLGDIPVAEQVKTWAATDEGKAFVGTRGSGGGGANGGGSGGKPPISKNNPWAKDTRNVTEQARLRDTEPERARTLAREAGVQPSW